MALLAGCGDPYKASLPIAGLPTPSQTEKLAADLPATDKELFLRWVKRKVTGESFGGEPTAKTVRDAVANQAEFEVRHAALAAQEAKQKEQDRLRALVDREKKEQEVRKSLADRDWRMIVNTEIQKFLQVKAESYEFLSLTNSYGNEVGRQWVFHLLLKNAARGHVIGFSGQIRLKDAFGAEMGTFPIRVEVDIPSGKTISSDATMVYDKTDVRQVAMTQTKTFFSEWILESVAYKDGSRMDRNALGTIPMNVTR
jgi:hypothetical protein